MYVFILISHNFQIEFKRQSLDRDPSPPPYPRSHSRSRCAALNVSFLWLSHNSIPPPWYRFPHIHLQYLITEMRTTKYIMAAFGVRLQINSLSCQCRHTKKKGGGERKQHLLFRRESYWVFQIMILLSLFSQGSTERISMSNPHYLLQAPSLSQDRLRGQQHLAIPSGSLSRRTETREVWNISAPKPPSDL